MINLDKFYNALKEANIEFISGVPDTLLNDFCIGLKQNWIQEKHVIAANEGNAIALAAGYFLATRSIPLVYMQNSGMGNAMNPLISLTDKYVYSIPMVLLIGWRGEPGSGDWPQHKRQGELSPVLLDALNIPYRILDEEEDDALNSIEWSIETASNLNQPTALLVKKNVLAKKEKSGFDGLSQEYKLTREEAITEIVRSAPKNTLFVASTGRITRELHAIRGMLNQTHGNDFLNVGAMGHAVSIASGIASAKPEKNVICLDGDAAVLMHMGSMAISANLKLNNLLHIVLNNGVHESVGGQDSVGFQVNLNEIAKQAGYRTLDKYIENRAQIADGIKAMNNIIGPSFIELRIKKGMRDDMPVLKIDTLKSKDEFIESAIKD